MPLSGELIVSHRLAFLASERRFLRKAITDIRKEATWGSYIGDRDIEEMVAEHEVDVRESSAKRKPRRRAASRRKRSARS